MMREQDRIVIDERILTGKPVIRGTRLAVEFVLDLLAQGWSEEQILEQYPGLAHEDVLACRKSRDSQGIQGDHYETVA
jgi:uncharacterized protein (DUF433 family)